MATQLIDTLLLNALPASGKSEVRRYLARLGPEQCRDDFRMGPTVQLDDYPYVHLMRRVSQHLRARDRDGIFFESDDQPMKDPRDWGTLVELLNEDYDDLVAHRPAAPKSAARWLLDRFDAARAKAGAPRALGDLPGPARDDLARAIEKEAAELVQDKNQGIPDSLAGKTVVIEFARGGKDRSAMPLAAPFGYRYSYGMLSEAVLAKASVLYVWVTPEESRRKNRERADPNDPGSILHHGVPEPVMYGDYGCDDIDWLVETSPKPGRVCVEARGKKHCLPIGRFDNRVDKTSFVRDDPAKWAKKDVEALHRGLKAAFDQLAIE